MKIKHWMTQNPITVKPGSLIVEASRLMKEHGVRRLPVVDKDKLVGILTQRHITEAKPSAATTLSIHELNYILANLTVKEVMHKKPICVGPEDSVMEVVMMGHKKGIGAFPVVGERGRLLGIVTEYEIFRAFVQLFGTEGDTMISLENVRLRERVGAMSRISSIIEGLDMPVVSIFSLPHRRSTGNRLFIRVGSQDASKVVEALKEAGYKIGGE